MKRSDIKRFIRNIYLGEKLISEDMSPEQKQDRIAHASAAVNGEEQYKAEDGSMQKVTFSKEEGTKILAESYKK
jgi:hypothetical protein